MINEDELMSKLAQKEQEAQNEKESKIEQLIKRDLAKVKQAEKRAKEKKQKETGIATTIRFYNGDDVARLNKLKKQLAGQKVSLSAYLSDMVAMQLANDEKEIVLKDIKSDLFYSFRKSFYASLSPFQHNIIAEIENVEDEVKILNEKVDLILEALCGYNISKADIEKINAHKKAMLQEREKEWTKRKKLDETREETLNTFQNYDIEQKFDSEILKDEIDDEIFE
ncbi:Mbov_0398 family ICE element protein [Mycoplasma sp. Z407A]|uniref:Mbov_0398 family ICE element protein n=1 Tax=Mycoplasma sp. Z407A TaxID=3401678 RepID=UPI003AB001C9